MANKWYAIQTYAGSEMAVKRAIEALKQDEALEAKIGEVLVPTEDVIIQSKPLKSVAYIQDIALQI